jgi:crotonobetainyl-CoA:carnitine CoA-transferase CaiB-like acyl-CoA transferase
VNRDKRSLAVDLKNDAGRRAFLRMVARADVVVESFRPGVMDKLGVGFAALRQANPRIVLLSISGYGQDGPYRERAGHDLNHRTRGRVRWAVMLPVVADVPGVRIADLAGGAHQGRPRSSARWSADTAPAGRAPGYLDVRGSLTLWRIGNMDCGAHPTRGKETLNGGLACYSVYKAKDDRYLAVGALEPKFWIALNTAIGRPPNVAELVGKPHEQAKTRAELAAIFATHRAEWHTALPLTTAASGSSSARRLSTHLSIARCSSPSMWQASGRASRSDAGGANNPRRRRASVNTRAGVRGYGFSDADDRRAGLIQSSATSSIGQPRTSTVTRPVERAVSAL